MAGPRESKLVNPHSVEKPGPLTRQVLQFEQTLRRLLPTAKTPQHWAALEEFVAVDDFERVGNVLEVQNWQQYTQMLARWASATIRFETTLRRVAEVPGRVYFEVEERHYRENDLTVVNSLTVFEFDGVGRIRRLDVYLQR